MSKELGIRLYCLRVNRTDYTHSKIAEILDIDRSTYTNYELGKTEPSLRMVKQLAGIFGVSCDELLEPALSETEIADYEALFNSRKRRMKSDKAHD